MVDFSRRRLPHLHSIGEPVFITFRLHGSLPAGRVFPQASMTSGQAFLVMDRLPGAGRCAPVHWRRPEFATLVHRSIQHGAGIDYDLHAWVIMPNHVHLLLTPRTDMSSFLRRLKGFSSRAANRLLGRTGQPFWQDESYDHQVRTPKEFRNIERYIVTNPVSAGLVARIEDWAWSSATPGA